MSLDPSKIANLADNWRAVGFLTANYQGRFAAINILGQLNSIDFKKTELEETKAVLKKLAELVTSIKNGRAIFFPTAEDVEEQSPEELRASQELLLNTISQLKYDIEERASKTEQFLALSQESAGLREAQYLLSGYGWYAYSRDNYARSMLEITEFSGDLVNKEAFEILRNECAQEIKLTNDFLKALKKGEQTQANIFEHIWFFCRTLPGILRANSHDLNLLMSFRNPTFTYAEAGFTSEEESSWSIAGFDPEVAGYWRAYGFTPEQALIWLQAGVNDPKLSAEWGSAGFSAEVSSTWIAVQFNPLLAIQWYNAGYKSEQAAFLVSKGFHHPAQIRPEQIPALAKEFEESFKKQARSEEEAWFGTSDGEEEN